MNSMKRQNDRILKEELPRLVGAQYATGDQWRKNSRKNERIELKQNQYPAVVVTGVQTCALPISGVYPDQPGEFLFKYPIILPFHTVHGVLKARILKWFAKIGRAHV